MKKIIILILLGLIPFGQAWARSDMEEHFYTISGNSCDELKQQMRAFGPSHDDTTYDGATPWQMVPDWKFEQVGEGWRVGIADANLKMKFHIPSWTNKDKGELALQGEWKRFLEALKKHEKEHEEIGVRAAEAIEKAVLALPPAKSSEEINQKADRVAQNILSQFLEKEKAYDQETRQGLTQGVYFCR